MSRGENYHQLRRALSDANFGKLRFKSEREADWVFIAGNTEWKLSDAAADVMLRAREARMYIHVGRVNSQRRYRHFRWLAECLDLDIVSCDGTAARFHPAQALRRLTDVIEETSPLLR